MNAVILKFWALFIKLDFNYILGPYLGLSHSMVLFMVFLWPEILSNYTARHNPPHSVWLCWKTATSWSLWYPLSWKSWVTNDHIGVSNYGKHCSKCMFLRVSVVFTHVSAGSNVMTERSGHLSRALSHVRWLADCKVAFAGTTVHSSIWPLIIQKVILGLVSWLWQHLEDRRSVQGTLKYRFRTGTLSLMPLSVGQSKTQSQLNLKG